MKKRDLEADLILQCRAAWLPEPERQRRVCDERKWRWDLWWPSHCSLNAYGHKDLAVEIMGATWAHGRHTRGAGYRNDCHKANAGVIQGVRVLRFTSEDIDDGYALETIAAALGRPLPPRPPAPKKPRRSKLSPKRGKKGKDLPERVSRRVAQSLLREEEARRLR